MKRFVRGHFYECYHVSKPDRLYELLEYQRRYKAGFPKGYVYIFSRLASGENTSPLAKFHLPSKEEWRFIFKDVAPSNLPCYMGQPYLSRRYKDLLSGEAKMLCKKGDSRLRSIHSIA